MGGGCGGGGVRGSKYREWECRIGSRKGFVVKGPGYEGPTDVSVYPKHFSFHLACFC